jgi:hypothetical protein
MQGLGWVISYPRSQKRGPRGNPALETRATRLAAPDDQSERPTETLIRWETEPQWQGEPEEKPHS